MQGEDGSYKSVPVLNDNGHIDEDQAALVKYYEDKMGVKVGREETAD